QDLQEVEDGGHYKITIQVKGADFKEAEVNGNCNTLLDSKLFMLDMLYSQSPKPSAEEEEEDVEKATEKGEGEEEDRETHQEANPENKNKEDKSEHRGSIRPFAERFGDLVKDLGSSHPYLDAPANEPPPPPPKKESDTIWDQLLASPRELCIRDINFTDLTEDDDKDILDAKTAADGKRQEIIVLDSKRSNAINIGLTVLPPPRTIKTAILNFDEYALNKEGIEEVAEPLQDLKEGMEQLVKNKTLRYILSTLLSIGNFLNGVSVDFDQLQETLCQMERRCKASWDHLKVIAKHEMKPQLKQKMSDFLKDCAERIIILKIVHCRLINR
ncbi:hypothetical protein XENOCAPTIV_001589, partial [Xenoophorus captivus]